MRGVHWEAWVLAGTLGPLLAGCVTVAEHRKLERRIYELEQGKAAGPASSERERVAAAGGELLGAAAGRAYRNRLVAQVADTLHAGALADQQGARGRDLLDRGLVKQAHARHGFHVLQERPQDGIVAPDPTIEREPVRGPEAPKPACGHEASELAAARFRLRGYMGSAGTTGPQCSSVTERQLHSVKE